MKTSTLAVVVVIIVAIIGLGWWWVASAPAPAGQQAPTGDMGTGPGEPADSTGGEAPISVDVGGTIGTAPMTASVTYGSGGFSPQEVIVKKGGSVTWFNSGGGNMWVATAQHPTHTVYAGTSLAEHCDDATDVSFDQCKNGSQYSFTFSKAGTWAYHNHSNAAHFGRVIVVE